MVETRWARICTAATFVVALTLVSACSSDSSTSSSAGTTVDATDPVRNHPPPQGTLFSCRERANLRDATGEIISFDIVESMPTSDGGWVLEGTYVDAGPTGDEELTRTFRCEFSNTPGGYILMRDR